MPIVKAPAPSVVTVPTVELVRFAPPVKPLIAVIPLVESAVTVTSVSFVIVNSLSFIFVMAVRSPEIVPSRLLTAVNSLLVNVKVTPSVPEFSLTSKVFEPIT